MDIQQQIGRKIKDLRNRNGLTQQELADRTELTKGYISQLERGQVTPSVITLLDLIECLGSTPSDFFKQAKPLEIVFHNEDYFEKVEADESRIEWLVPMAQKNQMEPVRMTIPPKTVLAKDKPHDGEEFGYVLKGQIRLHFGDQIHTVSAGESFYYDAKKVHYIENAAAKVAQLIWVTTPPSF